MERKRFIFGSCHKVNSKEVRVRVRVRVRVQRTDLLAGIYSLVRPYGYVNLANDVLLQILLYGDKNFPNNLNRSILELTIRFIHSTGRFE